MSKAGDDSQEIWLCTACFDSANEELVLIDGDPPTLTMPAPGVASIICQTEEGFIYVCRCTPHGHTLH